MDEVLPGSDDAPRREAASAEESTRRLRFTMRTLMIFVLTAAVASAMFGELARLLKGLPMNLAIDVPSIVLTAIALNAVALGCLLRLSVDQVLVQITVCCLLVLAGAWLWEWKLDRGLRYWLQASFAAVVVLPLLIKAAAMSEDDPSTRSRRVVAGVEVLLLAYANYVAILVVAMFQTLILVLLAMLRR